MTNIFYPILQMIGALEEYEDFSKIKSKLEQDFRKICNAGKSLLSILGEERVSEIELEPNSVELKGFIRSLRTLSKESEQEEIDEEVVKLAYRESVKYAPSIIREISDFYSLFGPEADDDE